MLDLALAPSTWRRYRGSLLRFRDHCWQEGVSFPPEHPAVVAAIANFIESATRASLRPSSTINGLLAAIATLYEPLGVQPTHDPLIKRLRRALVRDRTKRPIDHGRTFDLSSLTNLFKEWGCNTSLQKTRAKLLALLCVLGALRVSAAILPRFNQIRVENIEDRRALVVPIVGYKNDLYGEGHTVRLFECSDKRLCPVATWKHWVNSTATIRSRIRDPRIVFELERPHDQLSPSKCAAILKGVARTAGLDPTIFTARTFRKSGVMAAINTGIDSDAIFRLGGWRDPATFHRHYVVTEIPSSFSDILFDVDDQQDANDDDDEGQTESDSSDDDHPDIFDHIS